MWPSICFRLCYLLEKKKVPHRSTPHSISTSFLSLSPPPSSSNGTYAPEPGGYSQCLACPGGKFVNHSKATECGDCPLGRFINHTGEGFECAACPAGRSSQSPSGYFREGLRQCNPCSRNNGKRGGNFYFQDEVGQKQCKKCKNSGAIGGLSCDEVSGEIIFEEGHCWGLYTPKSKCRETQDIYTSAGIAYGTFILTVFVLVPFILLSGGLASISKVLRRDISVAAQWMTVVTENAYDLIQTKFDEKKRRWREQNVRSFFAKVRSLQKWRDGWLVVDKRVNVDPTFGRSLNRSLGIGSDAFIALLKEALFKESRENEQRGSGAPLLDRSKLPWALSFAQYRRFISLVVQRLAHARNRMQLRLVFRDVANGRPVIDAGDFGRLSETLGASALDRTDLRILARHNDRNGGALDVDAFLDAMLCIMVAHKVRQLCDEKAAKDGRIRAAFLEHARGPRDEPYLDVRAFKTASLRLGVSWCMRTIRDIKHAAKQRECGMPLKRKHSLLHATLEFLESGAWQWLAAFPLVVLALHYGSSNTSMFSDILVPIVLSTEVLLRLGCSCRLGQSLSRFLQRRDRNAVDVACSALDLVLVLIAIRGALKGSTTVLHISRYARLARVLPVASAFRHVRKLCGRRGGGGDATTGGGEPRGLRVTLDDFRRFYSATKMDDARERPIWPINAYRDAFMKFDQVHGTHSGAVPLRHLSALVHETGHWPSPYQIAKVKEVLLFPLPEGGRGTVNDSDSNDDDGNFIYFEDFVNAMTLLRDERIESKMLACFESKERRALRTRIYIGKQLLIGVVVAFVGFVGALLTFAANVYVLTTSTYGTKKIGKRLESYTDIAIEVAASLESTFPLARLLLIAVAVLLRVAFEVLVFLGSYFEFVSLCQYPTPKLCASPSNVPRCARQTEFYES